MLVRDFPRVTFLDQVGDEQTIDLAQNGHVIGALAQEFDRTLPTSCSVGLVFRSTPELILSWLAALASGREPLILQYPTKKQAQIDWLRSVENSIKTANLAGLIVDPDVAAAGFDLPTCPVSMSSMQQLQEGPPCQRIEAGTILQLSSGTTGHRKPIRFTLDQVKHHVTSYADVLLQDDCDCIVSWLPLYHDMGFIACFLLPLLTGTRLVMMDPIDWVNEPERLFKAIERHAGTICFMPNFAFELLARKRATAVLSTMRRWISCSEPVYEATLLRFQTATGAQVDTLQACYAMAENVFAVTQSQGMKIVEVDGERRVSCGVPIPGCDVKIIDDQIWVRSNASITGYVGSSSILDEDGFYPTGDLGELTPDGLVVVGRVHDLINIAGRKYLLNDLDRILREVVPESRGRSTTAVYRSEALGTEQPFFFAEDEHFYDRLGEEPVLRAQIAVLSGIETCAFHFVPPHFITKTSSGKANRRMTIKNWMEASERRVAGTPPSLKDAEGLRQELKQYFGDLPPSETIGDIFDSLGFITLQLMASSYGVFPSRAETLDQVLARIQLEAADNQADNIVEHIEIVALADARLLTGLTQDVMDRCAAAAGCPVTLEHVCLPPSPILLNDIIFHDYFLSRQTGPQYGAVEALIAKVKRASLLIVDDVAELAFPYEQVFPKLDFQFRRDPQADLLAYRWQQYARYHHQLPLAVEHGSALPKDRNAVLDSLSRYLGIPILRIATLQRFEDVTEHWDHIDRKTRWHNRSLYGQRGVADALVNYIAANASEMRRQRGSAVTAALMIDLPHFCSWLINPDPLNDVLNRYDKFCLLGMPASVQHIVKQLGVMGKTYFHFNDRDLSRLDADSYDCVLMTGAWGEPITSKPVYQIFMAGFSKPGQLSDSYFLDDRVKAVRREVYKDFNPA